MVDPALRSLRTLDELTAGAPRAARWSLDEVRGRFVEISARGAAATLTAALDLVIDAQAQDEPAVWIMLPSSTFFPPDASDSGVDLAALAVIRACDVMTAARSAERLVRSGAFGVVVIDLGDDERDTEISLAIQGRLVALAQTHHAAIVCLTDKSDDAASLGSLVSLRAGVLRDRNGDRFAMAVRALKDKCGGPGWTHVATRRGPTGWT
jgi:recombination protein RecA